MGGLTKGDCIFIIEKLIAKGFIKEKMKNGQLNYDVTKLAEMCFYQCSECHKYFSTLNDLNKHQDFEYSQCYHKDTHFYLKNKLTKQQSDFISKELET